MEFEVWDTSKPDVTFEPAKITFPAMSFYMVQAEKIANYIKGLEVTEDNVKDVKKDLAAARKVTKALSDRRIAIKREILRDYEVFEQQIKDLSAVIDDADIELREKVNELERQEQRAKLKKIEEIWGKRIGMYQIGDLDPNAFDMWFDQRYLNKTVTLKSVEDEMVEWLESTEKDIEACRSMDDEVLIEYLGTYNLAKAIQNVNEREQLREMLSEDSEDDDEEERTAIFLITGDKDIKLTEMILKENNINYRRK